MEQHLLGRGQRVTGFGVLHGVEQVEPLGIDAEHLGRDPERIAERRLPEVVDVRLDGEERAAGVPVLLVDADEAEQLVGRPPEGGQESPFGHVAVVVDPIGLDLAPVEVEWGSHVVALGPRSPDRRCMDASLPLGDDPTRPEVERAQGTHHVDDVVVAQALEFGDRTPIGLFETAVGHRLHQVVGELGGDQPRPRQLQRRTELAEHVPHALFTAGQVEGEVGAHAGPTQSGTVGDGVVQFGRRGDAVVDEVEDLTPERLLEPVGEVALDLGAYEERVHHEVVVVNPGHLHRFRGGLPAGDDLDQGQQVDGVEGVADQDTFGMLTALLEAGRKQSGRT